MAGQSLVNEEEESEKKVGDKANVVVIDVEETIANEDDGKDGKRLRSSDVEMRRRLFHNSSAERVPMLPVTMAPT